MSVVPPVANPHLATPLRREGPPPSEARLAVLLVHGRGQDTQYMVDVADRVALPDLHYVLPAAAGNSWYPGRFMDPVAANEPELTRALAAIDATLATLEADGYGPERTALMGFSQGACLLAEHVVRRPRPYAALALLTGGFLGPDADARTADGTLPGTQVLLSTSAVDEWVPPDRVRQTAGLLEAMGATVTLRVHDAPVHGVDDEEVQAVRALLDSAGR
jgi:phospholipase/carboxylesterase